MSNDNHAYIVVGIYPNKDREVLGVFRGKNNAEKYRQSCEDHKRETDFMSFDIEVHRFRDE